MTSPSLWQTLGAVDCLSLIALLGYIVGYRDAKYEDATQAAQLRVQHLAERQESFEDGRWKGEIAAAKRQCERYAVRQQLLAAERAEEERRIVADALANSSARRAEQGRQP